MIIRKYHPKDFTEVVHVFYAAVHAIENRDYTKAQLEAWAPAELKGYLGNESLLRNYVLVAEEAGKIIGFGDCSDEGYLDRLYVHPCYQRQGVATGIADELEKYAVRKGAKTLTTHASVTAKPFFEKRGFLVMEKQSRTRKGQSLTNFLMEKSL